MNMGIMGFFLSAFISVLIAVMLETLKLALNGNLYAVSHEKQHLLNRGRRSSSSVYLQNPSAPNYYPSFSSLSASCSNLNLTSFFVSKVSSNSSPELYPSPSPFSSSEKISLESMEYVDKHWLNSLFSPDESGVLNSMAMEVEKWRQKEEYVKSWKVPPTEQYRLVSYDEKIRFLRRNALKYLDRRIVQEIKSAKKGTPMHTIGEAQKSLSPDSNVEFSGNFSMKIKAELLLGKATLVLNNPYLDWHVNFYAYSNSRVVVHVGRELSSVGLQTGIDYSTRNDELLTTIDKRISEYLFSRISLIKRQDCTNTLTNSDQKIEFIYKRPL